jgi:hypothetical protein
MKKEDYSSLSRPWRPLIHILKEWKKVVSKWRALILFRLTQIKFIFHLSYRQRL